MDTFGALGQSSRYLESPSKPFLQNFAFLIFSFLDILVNNASKQIQCKDLADIDMDNVNDTFQTNIIAYIGVTKAALPHMNRGDCIIMTSSVTAYKGSAGMVDYSATKGAMNSFIRSLALQQVANGIRVCGVW